MLRKRPTVSMLAICVLAFGVGGTITVFSAVDALLLRELPYVDSDRLVTVWQVEPGVTDDRAGVAPGMFVDWRARTKAFTSLAAAEPFSLDYLEGPEPVSVNTGSVTEGFSRCSACSRCAAVCFTPKNTTTAKRTSSC